MNASSLSIDGREVAIRPGMTILDAARQAGVEIPTLCHLERCGPQTSCLVCLVKVNGKLIPSCGTLAQPGMTVESGTEEVHAARRTALELLFSDHLGDCLSPCERLCPLQLPIPTLLLQVQAGKTEAAAATVGGALPLAAVLGRLCHHPCEQGCRRGAADGAADIRGLERFAADANLALPSPHLPACKARTGKSAVVVGAGPAGIAAAFELTVLGHSVTLLDRHERAGGSLRSLPEEELPRAVLDAEIARLERLGVEIQHKVELGADGVTLETLRGDYGAVLLAVGERGAGACEALGVAAGAAGIKTDAATALTSVPGVFAAGAAVKPVRQIVRAMTEGRNAAQCMDRFLRGETPRRREKPFSSVMGRLNAGELRRFLDAASPAKPLAPCDARAGFSAAEASQEAARCLRCGCASAGKCGLQDAAARYGADATRFRGERRDFERQAQPGGVVFEPGKCILCGICVRITEAEAETLGLAFVGRGFQVRLAAPFGEGVAEGLRRTAAACAAACPTGALTLP
ncbi:MAG: 2Fe-2S iron-sulfur cluster-binding protein [Chthoniobacteraceae bacterium]|nr:2Fe-2S iron-sulfur cluster-binding protein [Chthoniobacteraceae bacterium]